MGTFSITIPVSNQRERTKLLDGIGIYDLVQIEFKTNEDGYKTEMIGLVSRPSSSVSVGEDGKVSTVYRIDGFDLGRVLQSFYLYFNPYITSSTAFGAKGLMKFLEKNQFFVDVTPATFVQRFLQIIYGEPGISSDIFPFYLVGNTNVWQYIDFASGFDSSIFDYSCNDVSFMDSMQSGSQISVWDIIKTYSDPPFHEVFIDLKKEEGDERYHSLDSTTPPYEVVMRRTPFGREDWTALNHHYFSKKDIIQTNVSMSEDNIFNYFELFCERQTPLTGQNQTYAANGMSGGRIPVIHKDSVEKYGLRRFPFTTTKFVEFFKFKEREKLTIMQKQFTLCRELWRWYSFGEMFESGSLVLKGRCGIDPNGITMGSRLIELGYDGKERLGSKEYYIEAVSQNFRFGNTLTTTLAVTRGHYPADRFSLIDSFEKAPLGGDVNHKGTIYKANGLDLTDRGLKLL